MLGGAAALAVVAVWSAIGYLRLLRRER